MLDGFSGLAAEDQLDGTVSVLDAVRSGMAQTKPEIALSGPQCCDPTGQPTPGIWPAGRTRIRALQRRPQSENPAVSG